MWVRILLPLQIKYQRLRFGNCLTGSIIASNLIESIKSKDEKVYQLSERVVRRAHQEDDLANLGQAAEFSSPGNGYHRHSRCSTLDHRLRFPASDDSNLHIVINR